MLILIFALHRYDIYDPVQDCGELKLLFSRTLWNNVNYCVVKYGITTMKTLPVVWTCHQVA